VVRTDVVDPAPSPLAADHMDVVDPAPSPLAADHMDAVDPAQSPLAVDHMAVEVQVTTMLLPIQTVSVTGCSMIMDKETATLEQGAILRTGGAMCLPR